MKREREEERGGEGERGEEREEEREGEREGGTTGTGPGLFRDTAIHTHTNILACQLCGCIVIASCKLQQNSPDLEVTPRTVCYKRFTGVLSHHEDIVREANGHPPSKIHSGRYSEIDKVPAHPPVSCILALSLVVTAGVEPRRARTRVKYKRVVFGEKERGEGGAIYNFISTQGV